MPSVAEETRAATSVPFDPSFIEQEIQRQIEGLLKTVE